MRILMLRVIAILVTFIGLYMLSQFVTYQMDPYYFQVLIECGVYIILAVSLNLINGITGQFSIGHAGFFAVGAYVGAAWTMIWQPMVVERYSFLQMGTLHGDILNLLIALILGMTSAGMAGFVVGLPSLRLRGDYLAIATLGFAEVIYVLLLNINSVGGARGLNGIPTLISSGNLALFWVFLFVIISIVLSRNIMQSVRGLTWLSVREDEIAADAMGVDTTKVKVTAFVIGSALAGAAGVLYAHFLTGISPDIFSMNTSILITTMVVLGGSGSVTGSVIAAIVLIVLPEVLRFLKNDRMVIYSVLLIVMMLTRPQGIFGTKEIGFPKWRRKQPKTEGRSA